MTAAMPASTARRGASFARAPIRAVLSEPVCTVAVPRGSVAASSPRYHWTVSGLGVCA